MVKEYTKQDIVGYYFEVSLAKEYTKEDILQWFECRNVSLWLKNIPNKILLATILKSLWLNDTDSLKKADADNDDDDEEEGDWYTNRDGYQACRWCRSESIRNSRVVFSFSTDSLF